MRFLNNFAISLLMIPLMIIIAIFTPPETAPTGSVISLPEKNEIELEKIWETKMDYRMASYVIEDGKIIMHTSGNSIFILDYDTGKVIKQFKPELNNQMIYGIAVNEGMLAINCGKFIVVYDIGADKEIFKYKAKNLSEFHEEVYMYKNTIICSGDSRHNLMAVDYMNGDVVWTVEDPKIEDQQYYLKKYKERYLYSSLNFDGEVEFDPNTGKTISKYPDAYGVDIRNEKRVEQVNNFEGIADVKFNKWLSEKYFGYGGIMENGSPYLTYGEAFYFHNQLGELQWQFKMDKDIGYFDDYGDYVFLETDDLLVILDTKTQKIVWRFNVPEESAITWRIDGDRLYLSERRGRTVAYNLQMLKQN